MILQDFETFVVGNPPPSKGGRYFIFVKLVTACGVKGYGEIYTASFHPSTIEVMVRDVCERMVMGSDPFQIETLWRRVYSRGYSQRPDPTLVAILSGIEIALWDIVGKATGRPIYDLLGGRIHEGLRSYTYLYADYEESGESAHESSSVYTDPNAAATRAQTYLDQGFTALKFDPAGPYSAFDPRQLSLEAMDRSIEFLKALREVVGTKADLLFGTHGQMTPAAAIRLARQMEPYDPLWFEEPVPPEMPEEMAKVARATSIPIASGERLTTKYEFARLLDTGAASILQMALSRSGGLLEGKKIASMAEAKYAQIAPHLYCGPIEGAANVQLAACTPNFLILESIERWDGFYAELLTPPMRWENGYVSPPTEPGLGVELNEEVARAHPYTGSTLHLDCEQDPVFEYSKS